MVRSAVGTILGATMLLFLFVIWAIDSNTTEKPAKLGEVYAGDFISELGRFFTTDSQIVDKRYSLAICMFAVCLCALLWFVSHFIISFCTDLPPWPSGFKLLLLDLKQNVSYFRFFILVAMEEIIARWLFLGILPQHPPFQNQILFCMIVGSIGWLVFKERYFYNIPNYLLIIPNFLMSIVYALVFLKFGLFASFLTHIATNSLVSLLYKVEEKNDKDFIMGSLALVYAMIASVLFHFSSSIREKYCDILIWLNNPIIKDWAFDDLFFASVIIIYYFKSVTLFLSLDQSNSLRQDGNIHEPPKLLQLFIGIFVLLSIVGILYAILLFVEDLQYRALILTLILCMFSSSISGSARVRNFWNTFVPVLTFVCLLGINDLVILLYLGLHIVIYVPFLFLERITIYQKTIIYSRDQHGTNS